MKKRLQRAEMRYKMFLHLETSIHTNGEDFLEFACIRQRDCQDHVLAVTLENAQFFRSIICKRNKIIPTEFIFLENSVNTFENVQTFSSALKWNLI